jgi:hypothetical protein
MTYELLSFDEPRRLKPHAWNIESSTLRRGTSLHFTGRPFPAGGRRYAFIPKVNPRDRSGDREVEITGRQVVVVIEASLKP